MRRKRLEVVLALSCIGLLLAMVMSVPVHAKSQTKQIILKYASTSSHQDCGSVSLAWWMDEVERRTNGQVKFEPYWAGTLVPGPQILDAIAEGIADAGQLILVYYSSKLPLHGVSQVPGTGQYSTWARAQAWMELYDRVPEIKAELDKYHAIPLGVRGSTGMNLISKKPVRSIADMKGMKIRVAGYPQHTVKELGAVPVYLKWPEIYTGFQRGTVDGTFQDLTAFTSLKLYEIGKYITRFHQADTMLITVMRKEVFNGLPDNIKKIISDFSKEISTTGIMREYYKCPTAEATYDFKNGIWKDEGIEFFTLSAGDEDRLSRVESTIREKWMGRQKKNKPTAMKTYNTFSDLCKEWDKKTPKEFVGK